MSRDTVACTASTPSSRSAWTRSPCVESWRVPPPAAGSRPAVRTCSRQHLLESRQAGVEPHRACHRERRRQPQDSVAGGADEQPLPEAGGDDGAGRTIEPRRRASGRGLAPRRRRGGTRARRRAARRFGGRTRGVRRRASPPRRRRARDRVAAERTTVVARLGTRPARLGDEERPTGSPLASPFASVTASGFTPAARKRRSCRVRPTPGILTSSKTSSEPYSSAAPARRRGTPGSRRESRPRPEPARRGSRPPPA